MTHFTAKTTKPIKKKCVVRAEKKHAFNFAATSFKYAQNNAERSQRHLTFPVVHGVAFSSRNTFRLSN